MAALDDRPLLLPREKKRAFLTFPSKAAWMNSSLTTSGLSSSGSESYGEDMREEREGMTEEGGEWEEMRE